MAVSTQDQTARSVLKNLRCSPRKVGIVVDMIRGKLASAALQDLAYSRRRVAKSLYKALYSAVSNAENNHGMDVDKLYVSETSVGKAMTLKRMHARARGRGTRINKPYSNVIIVLREKEVN